MRRIALVIALSLCLATIAEAKRDHSKVTVLVQATSGSNDPTQAVLALVGAWGIAEAGHNVQLVLAGEALYLLDDTVAASTVGVGLGSAKEWFARLEKHQVPIAACGACGKARNVSKKAIAGRKAKMITAKDFGNMVVAADRVVSY